MFKKKEKMVGPQEYSPLLFLKDFVVIQVILLYFVLFIGDLVSEFTELDMIITRYIPVAITTLISTLVIIKLKAKKCTKSEEKTVKIIIFLVPILLTVIIVGYGFYCVESNIEEFDFGIMKLLYSEEYINTFIAEARSMARQAWIITAASYLVSAEIMAFIASRNLKNKLQDEMMYEPVMQQPVMQSPNEIIGNQTSPIMQDENTSTLNNIKWDL